MAKVVLSGNEAIARGAFEAGVLVASAYPGTPSTEILENIARYPEIDASWAPNEKVALEVAIGASFGGGRTLACMKHVGVNVAADPLFTLSYTGVRGGLVLVAADDPEMHSSQNEQDSRNYAKFAKLPMLEPADSRECLEFTRLAFDLSEQFDTPVMLRSCTRISHGKSIVELGERVNDLPAPKLVKDAPKLVMLPGNARVRHPLVEERIVNLSEYGDTSAINRTELRSTKIGIICAGVVYQYVREALPEASVLKLGMVYPLPQSADPRICRQGRAAVRGRGTRPVHRGAGPGHGDCRDRQGTHLPLCGELSPGRIRAAFAKVGLATAPDGPALAQRAAAAAPPQHVPGVPAPRPVLHAQPPERLCHRRYRLLHPRLHAAAQRHGHLCVHGRVGQQRFRHRAGPTSRRTAPGGWRHRRFDLPAHRGQLADGDGL